MSFKYPFEVLVESGFTLVERGFALVESGFTLVESGLLWRFSGQSLFQLQIPEIEKIELVSQGTENCQNLKYEGPEIVDPKYIEISSFAV